MAPVVVLVGPPGAGKSTTGAALARRLGVGFRDTDSDIEAATGRTIADIFVDDGEAGFRRLEQHAVGRALAEHDGVLAVGGGAVEDPDVRSALGDVFVVQLQVGATEAAKRAGLNVPRPMLLGNVRSRWLELSARRQPLYDAVADAAVSTDVRSIDEVVTEVAALVTARG